MLVHIPGVHARLLELRIVGGQHSWVVINAERNRCLTETQVELMFPIAKLLVNGLRFEPLNRIWFA